MKKNKQSDSGIGLIQVVALFFLWSGTTVMAIHAGITQPDKPYWIYRIVFGIVPSALLTIFTRSHFLSNRLKGLIFPLIIFSGASLCAYLVGGDPLYFMIITATMIICMLYLDHIGGILCLLITNVFIITCIATGNINTFSRNATNYEVWMNLALFNAISICQILFCRFTSIHFTRAKDSSATFEAVLNLTPNFLIVIDEQAKIVFVSESLTAAMAIPNRALVKGKPLLDLFHDPQIKLLLHEILESFSYWEKDFTLSIYGQIRYFFGRSCLIGDGKIARLFEWNDITALVESRNSALAAAEAKSSFLANMSHEIRTPMNAIKSLSELMLLTKLDMVQADYAHNIVGASESLLRIINDVLDFSKIDANKMEISSQNYDFVSFISDILNITNLKAAEKNLQFITDIDPSLPSQLYGDDVRIKQVLLNLISNAIKFTEKGSVKLTVKEISRDSESILIEYIVADTGIGIKEKDLNDLFGVFSQVDKNKNKAIEGTGLGLAISKRLVNMMGSDITVRSEYQKGSIFSFAIRQEISNHSPIAVVNNPHDLKVLLLGSSKKGEASCKILEDLNVKYIYYDKENEPDFSTIFAKEDITDIIYFYQDWNNIIRYKEFYQSKTIRLTAIKDIRLVSSQHTPSKFKFLFEPLFISNVASLLNGSDTSIRSHRNLSEEDTLGYFKIINANILIVDDNKVNLVVGKSVFKHYNILPDCAESGAEAIRMCDQKKYDIIFMDHMMPEMDGIEATSILLKSGGLNSETPIVALTANVVSGMREVFLENGMQDFIAKPIEIKELNRILKRFISVDRMEITYLSDSENSISDNDCSQKFLIFMEIGIDYRSALSTIGGSEEAYMNVLQTFVTTIPFKLDLLKKQMEDFKMQEDYNLNPFRIEIHALKSAFASIGATILSQKAKALEFSAASNNKSFIFREFSDFYEKSNKLLCDLTAFIPKASGIEKSQKKVIEKEKLLSPLKKIKEFLTNLESEEAEREIALLLEYSYGAEVDGLLEYIYISVKNFRIDEVFEAIDNIIDIINKGGKSNDSSI